MRFILIAFLFSSLFTNAHGKIVSSISLWTYPVEAIFVINHPKTGEMVIGSDYQDAYISTSGINKTIFWKYTKEVLNAGETQCI
jgi:hypothetical protein